MPMISWLVVRERTCCGGDEMSRRWTQLPCLCNLVSPLKMAFILSGSSKEETGLPQFVEIVSG